MHLQSSHMAVCMRMDLVFLQDYKETLKWWLKAANQGGVEAQHALGTVYRYGKDDFKQDYMEAFFWELVWAKTHKNDLESMRQAYDLSGASNLNTDQLASVYKRAAEWNPTADLSAH